MNVQHILTSALRAGGEYTVESFHNEPVGEEVTALQAELALVMLTDMVHTDGDLASLQMDAMHDTLGDLYRITNLSSIIVDDTKTDLEQREALTEASEMLGVEYTVETAKQVVEKAMASASEYFKNLEHIADRMLKRNQKRLANIKITLDSATNLIANTDDTEVKLEAVKFSPAISAVLAAEKKVDLSLVAARVNECLTMLKQINDGGRLALDDIKNSETVINPFFVASTKSKFGTPALPSLNTSNYWNIIVTEGGDSKISSLKFLSAGHDDNVDMPPITVKSLGTACNASLALYPKVLACLETSGNKNPIRIHGKRWVESIGNEWVSWKTFFKVRALISAVLAAEREIIDAMLTALGSVPIIINQNVNSNHS